MLYEQLKRSGRLVIYTDEPGGTAKGFQIRSILLEKDHEPLDPIAEFLLFEADRAQHVSFVIKPAMERGSDVICDRFSPSTFAYQGAGRRLARKFLSIMKPIDAFSRQDLEPDVYILLDIDPVKALQRIKGKKTKFEEEKIEFHKAIRSNFLSQAKQQQKKWLIIDATQSIQKVHEHIWNRIETLI